MIQRGPPTPPFRRAVGEFRAELERTRIEACDLRRRRARPHHEHRPQREEEGELLGVPACGVGQALYQGETFAQVADRLAVLRAPASPLARGQPTGDRALGVARLGPVMREELRRVTRLLR